MLLHVLLLFGVFLLLLEGQSDASRQHDSARSECRFEGGGSLDLDERLLGVGVAVGSGGFEHAKLGQGLLVALAKLEYHFVGRDLLFAFCTRWVLQASDLRELEGASGVESGLVTSLGFGDDVPDNRLRWLVTSGGLALDTSDLGELVSTSAAGKRIRSRDLQAPLDRDTLLVGSVLCSDEGDLPAGSFVSQHCNPCGLQSQHVLTSLGIALLGFPVDVDDRCPVLATALLGVAVNHHGGAQLLALRGIGFARRQNLGSARIFLGDQRTASGLELIGRGRRRRKGSHFDF